MFLTHSQPATGSLQRQGGQSSLPPISPPASPCRPFPHRLLCTRGGKFVGRAEGGAWSAAETPAGRFSFRVTVLDFVRVLAFVVNSFSSRENAAFSASCGRTPAA